MFLNYHKVLEISVKDHFWNDYFKVSGWKLLIAKTLILDFIICEIFLPTTVSQTLDPENLYLFLFLPFTLNFSITSLFRILNKLNALCAFHKKKVIIDIARTFLLNAFYSTKLQRHRKKQISFRQIIVTFPIQRSPGAS